MFAQSNEVSNLLFSPNICSDWPALLYFIAPDSRAQATPLTEYSELAGHHYYVSLVSPPAVGGEGSTDMFNIQYSLSLHIHLHFTLNICQTHALEINASHDDQ